MKVIRANKREVVTHITDSVSGVVLDTTIETKHDLIITSSDETFCTLFGGLISIVDGIDKLGWKVLLYCSQNCDINTNYINLGKHSRKRICELYLLSDGSVKNAVCRLAKTGALIRDDSSVYRVNPKYFWRGNQGERKKYILEIEYNPSAKNGSKKVKANINFDKEV